MRFAISILTGNKKPQLVGAEVDVQKEIPNMNMPILTQFGNSEQSMDTLDISELVQSRHDKVKQSVERLAERGVITLPPMGEKATAGRPTTFYVFSGEQGKLDSITVVAQLCPEFKIGRAHV